MQGRFVEKWERQRARGRLVYALIHGAVIGGFIALIYAAFKVLGVEMPENLTSQTIIFFAIGGFAYGLIRFNIRERFYKSMKGQTDDRS